MTPDTHAFSVFDVAQFPTVIVRNDVKREAARIRGRGATQAFGIAHRAVATLAEALDIASYRAKDAVPIENGRER